MSSLQCQDCAAPAKVMCSCMPQVRYCQHHGSIHESNTSHSLSKVMISVTSSDARDLYRAAAKQKEKLEEYKATVVRFTSKHINDVEVASMTLLSQLNVSIYEIQDLMNLAKTQQFLAEGTQTPLAKAVVQQLPISSVLALKLESFEVVMKLDKLELDENLAIKQRSASDPAYPNVHLTETPGRASMKKRWSASSKVTMTSAGPVCQSQHPLVWDNLVVFDAFDRDQTFWVKCDLCGSRFSRSCWTCQSCRIYMCEPCGCRMNCQAPKLTCHQGHELEWRSDAKDIYEKEYEQTVEVTCHLCHRRCSKPGSWHCTGCKYDVCQACGKQQGYKPYYLPTQGTNNEFFKPNAQLIDSSICTACEEIPHDTPYVSPDKSFVICQDCLESQKVRGARHPIVACPQRHLLYWVGSGSFTCQYCMRNKTEARHRCDSCDFDVCSSCATNLVKAVKNGLSEKCLNGHWIDWKPDAGIVNGYKVGWKCERDGRQFAQAGSFKCGYCKYNLCVECIPKKT